MDQEELKQRVLNFLKSQTKASIATTKENNPWISDLYYITDNFGNLYFLISKASQTSENLIDNSNVAVSIENNSEFGEKLKNVQIFGKGNFIVGEEVKEVLDNFEIKFPSLVEEDETFKDFQGNKAKERFLKVTPERMYFQDSEAFKGRLEISL